MKGGDQMRITLEIGEITLDKLEKLVQWLKDAPMPLNPTQLYTEVEIQNVKVQIKAPKIVPSPPSATQKITVP